METILIATDFSKAANYAANYAAQLSNQLDARHLILYHSYELLSTSPGIPGDTALSDGRLHEGSLDLLAELKQQFIHLVKPQVRISLITNGLNLVQGINNLAVEHGVNMVVIGLSSKDNWEKLLVGSSTGTILRSCHLPLLIVPLDTPFETVKKIVMGCDLNDVASTMPSEKIKYLIGKLRAKLLVVHVDHREEEHFDADMLREQYAFYDLFEEMDTRIHYADNKDVAKGILAFAEEQQAQLILVVAKKHSLLERITRESISKKLAKKAQLPLLIVR
ncbi:universal stress protein [Olivibacter sp. CPCC 100613]|uniref:universal stress protein n=1 Tax=Olivibacter sp. CPCC 100613 TaxID=3079931 RepID=UPI002FF63830